MRRVNIKELGPQVHKLKPVVIIGNKGLTDAVQSEISQALDHHELIKIKIAGGEREYREQVIKDVCQAQKATLIKQIGHMFAIYRKKPD
jgi:RNA-binding protein